VQANTQQRAELAKNQAELERYKEGVKRLKDSHREKLHLKEEMIEELEKKARKYKKEFDEQERRF
jgi:hypothetical protein